MTEVQWNAYLKGYAKAVAENFAFLEELGFVRSPTKKVQWSDDTRDHTVAIRYELDEIALEVYLLAINLFMGVRSFRITKNSRDVLGPDASPALDLETELRRRPAEKLDVPKWLGYPTLNEAIRRRRRSTFSRIATEHMDDCVALLAERLRDHGQVLLPGWIAPHRR